ncbi:DUF4838 domain-containing protein [Termitidicoccus mucosus]|uniref:Alpha glucuronidase N-terminal domain-containing protein n=1 Tax=Termitidicoccus mucosus TaxID=1184151 RepID=A0A178IEV4_9BACT|nr:hypothetical protein AW736_18455 [Opitutaceae bacterium TSB47]
MKPRKSIITAALILMVSLLSPLDAAEKNITVDFERCMIVIPNKRNEVVKYAIDELAAHIKLISGVDVPIAKKAEKGKFPIYVGIQFPDDKTEFKTEEARWVLTPNKGIYLYGRDKIGGKKEAIKTYKDAALSSGTEAGTLFAVYEFLENVLGIRWVEPGPKGTACTPAKSFSYTPSAGSYKPQLIQRHMRAAYSENFRARAIADGFIPADLQLSGEEFAQRQDDEQVWRRRMRMGRPTVNFTYGHAFTKWWDKYGHTHPEYFALNKNGKRAPMGAKRADRIKMCVSNPALIKQIVDDHFATSKGLVINACENDSRDFCTCDNCKALDVVLPGEENLAIDDRMLTDRYVHFVNAVLREAKKRDPRMQVAFYFYSRYNEPPRREKLDDGTIIFLLPNLGDQMDFNKYCDDWNKAGARIVFMRPNDLNQDTGLPHGFEEKMFSKLKIANNHFSLRGTDYDICYGFWPVSGVANYIMARGFYRPERSFENWNDEYCGVFGEASGDMKNYYAYWRQIWNKRIDANMELIQKLTGAGKLLLRTRISHLTDLLYDESDFDKTDAFLGNALKRNLTAWQKDRIENMQLANQHSRLKYRAMCANRLAATATVEEQKETAQALYDFRRRHRLDLNINWEQLIYLENRYEDNAGLMRLLGTESADKNLRTYWLETEAKFNETRGNYNTPLR